MHAFVSDNIIRPGAAVAALLFTSGKTVPGHCLGRASLASACVFSGAEFTRVTALTDGGRDFAPFKEPAERGRRI